MTHDLNNLLTIILGNVELARSGQRAGRPLDDMLGDVSTAAHRARELVAQVLTFSNRQPRAVRRRVDVGAIAAEVRRLLAASLPQAVEMVVECQPGVPSVMAVPSQLHQVLMNLCVNALHAMAGRPGRLGVAVSARFVPVTETHELPAGRYLSLRVTDTGVGMDTLTRARIFDPFFTTRPPGEGTGLGLSVVHGIVKAHGGAVLVQSRVGQGTSFEVLLPTADDPDPVH